MTSRYTHVTINYKTQNELAEPYRYDVKKRKDIINQKEGLLNITFALSFNVVYNSCYSPLTINIVQKENTVTIGSWPKRIKVL